MTAGERWLFCVWGETIGSAALLVRRKIGRQASNCPVLAVLLYAIRRSTKRASSNLLVTSHTGFRTATSSA